MEFLPDGQARCDLRIRRDHEDHDQTTAPEHTPAFEPNVALAAIKGDRTVAQLAEQFAPSGDIAEGVARGRRCPIAVKSLHAKIGEPTLENDFFGGHAHQGGIAERQAMIDRTHDLPITGRRKF